MPTALLALFVSICSVLLSPTSRCAAQASADDMWFPVPSQSNVAAVDQQTLLDDVDDYSLIAVDMSVQSLIERRAELRIGTRLARGFSLSGTPAFDLNGDFDLRVHTAAWFSGDTFSGPFAALGGGMTTRNDSNENESDITFNAFAELGWRYAIEQVGFTACVSWDVRSRRSVPSIGLMLGYTFVGS